MRSGGEPKTINPGPEHYAEYTIPWNNIWRGATFFGFFILRNFSSFYDGTANHNKILSIL